MRINSSGNVGIGTTSPSYKLSLSESGNNFVQFTTGSDSVAGALIGRGGDTTLRIQNSELAPISFWTNNTERARIDGAGRLLVGTSTAPTGGDSQYAKVVVSGNTAGSSDAFLALLRGQAPGSISSGAGLGNIVFGANDGSPYAIISGNSDGTSGSGDYPGLLSFSTTADGASSPTERMRITSTGDLRFNSGYGSVATAYGVRVWATANCSTDTITASGNVSSLTEIGGGEHRFNFTSSITTNYSVVATAGGISGATGDDSNASLTSSQQLAGSSRIRTQQNNVYMLNMIIVR